MRLFKGVGMIEALATIIVIFLMLVPFVNILVGTIAFGVGGFCAGLALTVLFYIWGKRPA